MHKKISIVAVIAIISLILIPSSLAYTFNQTSQTGTWNTATYPDFSVNSQNQNSTGLASYDIAENLAVTNNTGGLVYGLIVNHLKGVAPNWYSSGTEEFYYVLELYNNITNEKVYVPFYIAYEDGVAYDSAQVICGNAGKSVANPNSLTSQIGGFYQYSTGLLSDGINAHITTPSDLTNDVNYRIIVQRLSNTTGQNVYAEPYSLIGINIGVAFGLVHLATLPYDSVYAENLTVSNGFWENFNAKLYLGYVGSGNFNVTFDNMLIDENNPRLHQGFGDVVLDNSNPISASVGQLFGVLGAFIALIFSMINILSKIVGFIIPILPYIFLAYFADVVYTSIKEGSFQPIGDFMAKMIEYLGLAYTVCIYVGGVIWNAVTFWVP